LKKLITLCEVLVIAILLIKLVTLCDIITDIGTSDEPSFVVKQAIAGSSGLGQRSHPVKDLSEDPLLKERELLTLLIKRQQVLKEREQVLEREEQRLVALKEEILVNIETFNQVKETVTAMIETLKGADDKKYKDLVKVYEATPPDQASAMLERLDRKMAAAIIMRMKKSSAGEVWGNLDPATAVALTKEITKKTVPGDEATRSK